MAPKREVNLKEKMPLTKKKQNQGLSVKKVHKHTTKKTTLPLSEKRQALLDDKSLVKLPWSVSNFDGNFLQFTLQSDNITVNEWPVSISGVSSQLNIKA